MEGYLAIFILRQTCFNNFASWKSWHRKEDKITSNDRSTARFHFGSLVTIWVPMQHESVMYRWNKTNRKYNQATNRLYSIKDALMQWSSEHISMAKDFIRMYQDAPTIMTLPNGPYGFRWNWLRCFMLCKWRINSGI